MEERENGENLDGKQEVLFLRRRNGRIDTGVMSRYTGRRTCFFPLTSNVDV